MKKNKLYGMLILIVGIMLVFGFTACDNGGNGGNTRDPVTYTGTANSVTYTLKIEDGGARAVLTPTQGDSYTLTASGKTSTGTVSAFVSGVLTLTPSTQGVQPFFTVTVSGTSITAMTGSITWDNGTSENAPSTFTPSNPGGGNGTGWPSSSKLAEYNLGSWTQPTGIGGDIAWVETQAAGGPNATMYTLGITFTSASSAAKASIKSYLDPWDNSGSISWTYDDDVNGTYEVTYIKVVSNTEYSVYATWNTQNGGMGSFSLRRITVTGGGNPNNPFEDEYPDAQFPALTGGNDFIGTWAGDGSSYTLQLANTGVWTSRMTIGMSAVTLDTGRFLVSGNTVYLYWHETEDGPAYYYFNGYGVRSGNTLEMHGGMTYTGGDSWTKQ